MKYLVNYLERSIFNLEGTKEMLLKIGKNEKEYEILEYSDWKTKRKYENQFQYLEEVDNLDNIYEILKEDLVRAKRFLKDTLEEEGQYSKDEIKNYFEHLKFIEDNVYTIQEKIVAVLEDIFAKTKIDYANLADGFGVNTTSAIYWLDKREKETEEEYIKRIKDNLLLKNILEINLMLKAKEIEESNKEESDKLLEFVKVLRNNN